jgi:hypothetical protein
LCQGKLRKDDLTEQEAEESEIFPYIPTLYKQHYMFFKILTFLSVVLVVIVVTLNVLFHKQGWWSIFVVAGVICLWAVMFITFRKRKNVPKNILYQVVIISIISVLWDYFTGWRGWSVDFVIPIVCLSVMLAMVFISKIMNSDAQDFMIYTVIGGLFGIAPIVFLLLGILNVIVPSLICVAASIIFLSAIFIFQGNKMIMELKRRLHL